MKINPLHISPPEVVQTQVIQADPQPHLVCGLAEKFRGPVLQGPTCAIYIFAQY